MPRSLRIEKENGVYHIINRGNYRQDLFINEGTHRSFEKCLFETCEKCGWILEGFCVMTNHFHLVVRTPKGNLIYGMKWLQSIRQLPDQSLSQVSKITRQVVPRAL